jgi:hypothetical protein
MVMIKRPFLLIVLYSMRLKELRIRRREQDIRNPASALLGLIYGSIGGPISPYLAHLRSAQMEK